MGSYARFMVSKLMLQQQREKYHMFTPAVKIYVSERIHIISYKRCRLLMKYKYNQAIHY